MTGELLLGGERVTNYSEREWRQIRGQRIAMIYQHPEQALHPAIPIGRQLSDLLRSHTPITRLEAEVCAKKMLERVALKETDRVMRSYPFQLSGGMNQRVMIAMVLLLQPKLLIADEPTSALDVTTQAEIVALLKGLVYEERLSMYFITHDLTLAARIATSIAVMQQGRIIEKGEAADVLLRPKHDYTKTLVSYLPRQFSPVTESY